MIEEKDINKALQWLVDNADRAAEANSTKDYLDDFTKVIKAEIMSEHLSEPVNSQERFACSDQRYKIHLEGLRVARKEDFKYRWLRDTALAKIEAWRTQSSNLRGVK
jgi:ABC-type uncharacterized transport system fused permease/ATPase subunit